MASNCFICGWPDDPNISFCPGCWHPKASPSTDAVTVGEVIAEIRATGRAMKAQNEIARSMAQLYEDQMAGDEAANAFLMHMTWDVAAEFSSFLAVGHSLAILDDDPELPVRLFDAGSMSQWLVTGDFTEWISIAYLPYFGGILEGDIDASHNERVIDQAFAALSRAFERTLNEARGD